MPGVVCGARRRDVAEMTLDLDSTVCEVCGKAKHGAAYGHTKVLGYHPLVAVRSDTGEVLAPLGCGRDPLSAATCTSLVRPWRACGAWGRLRR